MMYRNETSIPKPALALVCAVLLTGILLLSSCSCITIIPAEADGTDTSGNRAETSAPDPAGDSSGTDTVGPQDSGIADYRDLYREKLLGSTDACYFTYDMDGDGIPELFLQDVYTSNCEIFRAASDADGRLSLVSCGTIGFEESGIDLCPCADGGVYAEIHKMDTPTHVYRYILENGKMKGERVYGELEFGRAMSDAMQSDGASMFFLHTTDSENGLEPEKNIHGVRTETMDASLSHLADYFHLRERKSSRFVDDEYYVTDEARKTIEDMLGYYTVTTGIDFNIEILPHLDGDGAFGHIEWRYDYEDLGVGSEHTGFVLLLDEDENMMYFETFGLGFLTDEQLDAVFDTVEGDPFEDSALEYFGNFVQYLYNCVSENDWSPEPIGS